MGEPTRIKRATMPESQALDVVLASLQAIEAGATGEALGRFYADDVVQEELPNKLNPAGARRDKAGILAAAEAGKQAVTGQRFEVVGALADGDRVALEVVWTATLRVAVAGHAAGSVMRARLAIFAEVSGGKIYAQRNYDCFESPATHG
ncbi:MAG: nuclear transport factor 2 family protein [Kofleriaceae bacterium]